MYEQFLYYWLCWIIVIIICFFMNNSKMRSFLFIWILFILITSETFFVFSSIQLSVAFIILIIGAIILFVYHSFTTYTVTVTFTVMISYIALLMWDKVTPVWFFMPTYLITPIMTVFLITVLIKPFYTQLTTALVGASFGHVIFELLLISYRLNDTIGDKLFFIHTSLTILILIVLRFVQVILYTLQMTRKRKLI